MQTAVGPFNLYNVYDNCPADDDDASREKSKNMWHAVSGKSMSWVVTYLHDNQHRLTEAQDELNEMGAGYDWNCGQFDAIPDYFSQSEVRDVLHLPAESMTSSFNYNTSGPASVTLYPSLLKSGLRVLIYNGDADACVPYIGNEIWTTGMEERGFVEEVDEWHTWYVGRAR